MLEASSYNPWTSARNPWPFYLVNQAHHTQKYWIWPEIMDCFFTYIVAIFWCFHSIYSYTKAIKVRAIILVTVSESIWPWLSSPFCLDFSEHTPIPSMTTIIWRDLKRHKQLLHSLGYSAPSISTPFRIVRPLSSKIASSQ